MNRHAEHCPRCRRILFRGADGLLPYHKVPEKPSKNGPHKAVPLAKSDAPWCVGAI